MRLPDGDCVWPASDGRFEHCTECMRQADCKLLRLCRMRRFGKTLSPGTARDNLILLVAMGVRDYNRDYGTCIASSDLPRIDEQIELGTDSTPSEIAQTISAIAKTWRR